MALKQKFLGAQRFNGEVDGKKIESGKIFTLTDCKSDNDHFGHAVGSFSVGYFNLNDYIVCPAYYELDLNLVGNTLSVVGCKRLSDKLDLMSLQEAEVNNARGK